MTGPDRIHWLSDGLAELERAIAAREWPDVYALADFIDARSIGGVAHERIRQFLMLSSEVAA